MEGDYQEAKKAAIKFDALKKKYPIEDIFMIIFSLTRVNKQKNNCRVSKKLMRRSCLRSRKHKRHNFWNFQKPGITIWHSMKKLHSNL